MVLDVVRALGRRWYFVAVGLLLTSGLVLGAYLVSPPKFHASALVLMLPARSDVGKGGNPFLMLTGLEQPAGILAAYFSSAPARTEVERVSPKAEYEIGIDDSSRGPLLAVDVTDESAAGAMGTLNYLLQQMPAELTKLQQQVDARGSTVVSSMPLSVDVKAERDARGTVRAMIAALVAGLVGTGVVTYALDGMLARRRRAATADEVDEAPSEPVPDLPPTEDVRPVAAGPQAPLAPGTPRQHPEPPPKHRKRASPEPRKPVPAGWTWGEPEP